jgi:hypothetical protein
VTPELAESLSRTLLLMRDEFEASIEDAVLLSALTSTRVALVTDEANISSHSAQTAFITAAILMARSGHQVFLVAPNVRIIGPQPPLLPGRLIEQLLTAGRDLLPGIEFTAEEPDAEVDLLIGLGSTPLKLPAARRIRLNAEPWAGIIMPQDQPRPWGAALWPFGALAAGGLGAGEAFKIAMQKLLAHALNKDNTGRVFANTDQFRFELAPPDTLFCQELGAIDCVSGGAITNAVLYCLSRIPAVRASGRIIEPETADWSNLNRYMMLLRSAAEGQKAHHLAAMLGPGLQFEPVPYRFEPARLPSIAPLAPTVIVGVDHIPTRWAVQAAMPEWLVVGATTHWSAMASFHSAGLGCARCLHNRDDQEGRPIIPTTACVSFWAGLLASAYLVRRAAGEPISPNEQQIYLTPFRPETAFTAGVPVREDCPTCRHSGASSPGAAA